MSESAKAPDGPSRWFVFTVAAVAAFMSTLDSSIVNVALPTIAGDFRSGVGTVSWVVQSYLLAVMAFLLIGGRLLDLFGARSVFAAGFALFTAGSALCAAAASVEMLILSRALQGIGASVLMSSNQGLVARAFPKERRGRTLGMIGAVVSVGLASGPPLGGFLIGCFGWRSIFFINLPVGAAATALSLRVLPGGRARGRDGRFDLTGAVLAAAGLVLFFAGLDRGVKGGFGGSAAFLSMGTACLFFVFFLLNEARRPDPLVDLGLFKSRFFSQSCAAAFLAFAAMISAVFLAPFHLQVVEGLRPEGVGIVMTALPAAMLLAAPLGGWVSDRIGTRIPATCGLLLVGAGLYLLSGGGRGPATPGGVAFCLALIGTGMGFFGSPNVNAILSSVPGGNVGVASGLSALMRTAGMSCGIAFAAAAFTFFRNGAVPEAVRRGLAGVEKERFLYARGIGPVFIVAVVIAAVDAIVSATRGLNPRSLERSGRGAP